MENKDMSGVLFPERDKKNEKGPDYRGKCVVNGKALEIAGWKKQSKNGNPYLSISFQPPYVKDKHASRTYANKDNDDETVGF